MRRHSTRQPMVLAVAPSVRGFGYVVFQGPRRLLDWEVRSVRGDKNAGCLAKLETVIAWHKPDILVLEDPKGPGSRRGRRVTRLLAAIRRRAASRGIAVHRYSRGQIRDSFAPFGAKTKFEIASLTTDWMPELLLSLPPKRKPWLPEHARMAIFDAAALALTFYGYDDV